MSATNEVWARLVSLGKSEDVVEISSTEFTIGRLPANDLSFPNNKLISQNHCKITREEGNAVFITDSSTNGTQVDGTKVKQRKSALEHGDEIHIVFKKNSSENNIAYLFEVLSKTLSADSLEQTQEYDDPVQCTELDEPPRKQAKTDKAGDEPVDSAVAVSEGDKMGNTNEIDETLLCIICQELLHDCVSLQPCMHTFCAGCFSQWMKKSKNCPTCRKKGISVAQNHILRNLIEVYVKSHPEKKRDAIDIAELDKHNTIKKLHMKLTGRDNYDESNSDDDYDQDDSSSSNSNFDEDLLNPFAPVHTDGPIRIPAALYMNIPVCRQCPGFYASRLHVADPASAGTAAADTSANYACSQGTQKHIICFCCMEMFPDRRDTPDTPPVSCEVCSGTFCHLYWKCKRPDCKGCLTKLKDMEFRDSILDNILLQSPVESSILKEYMLSKAVTVQDILEDTCVKLDRGDFELNNDFGCNLSGKRLRGDSIICNRCGSKAFRQLAYYYRKHIPADDLPEAVTRKSDCYWGKHCRTQKKPAHAAKLNHICEQTRFT